ncbi:cytidylate kinase-like family protein [Bacteroidales bacterium OttesenSCG-928-J19]|nr:cytidylate kinase-like family protein [Bacteroidales bacterium OttesenSCG-928-J19]
MENNNYIITIGRQLGSGGKSIGEALSKELGIPCYDKELLSLASKESGLGKEYFEQMDEKESRSFFGSLMGFRSGYMGSSQNNYLSNETLFKIQSDTIRELAQKGSCIFVGRCADYILREHPHLISVFITADPDDRITRIAHDNSISKQEAETLIEKTDKKRASYYNYYSNKVWGLASSYDLCINSSILGLEKTTEFILEFVKDWRIA